MSNIETQVKHLVEFEDKLVPGAVKAAMKESGAKSSDLWRVPPASIKVREGYNPRIDTPSFHERVKELSVSMIANGYFDDKPIGVSVAEEDGKQVLYIEDGHRRHAAAMLAIQQGVPIETLPVIAMPRSYNEVDRLVHMVRSNNDTEPFKPLELGVIVQRLSKFGLQEDDIAKRLGVTTTYIRQLETLMAAPKMMRDMVRNGEISATLAIETMQEHKGAAAEVMEEAKALAKQTGKRVTGKVVKKAAEQKKSPKKKPTIAELTEKSARAQKKHAHEAFDLLKRVMDKHGKVIDNEFHVEVDALFVQCGVIG